MAAAKESDYELDPPSNNNSYCKSEDGNTERNNLDDIIIDDQWQDDDLVPSPMSPTAGDFAIGISAKPSSLQFESNEEMRRRKLSVDQPSSDKSSPCTLTLNSDDISGLDDMPTPDEIATPDGLESPGTVGVDLEWDNDTPVLLTEDEEGKTRNEVLKQQTTSSAGGEMYRMVIIGQNEYKMDFKAIIPYRQVLSHGGYYGEGLNAIVVFSACFLPDTDQTDYDYIMENLFLYVVSTLDLLVAEDYMIIFFNAGCKRKNIPSLAWLKKCYQMIHRRLRKNLKQLVIVHPSWYMRIVITFFRPFISKKFSRKLKLVNSLTALQDMVSLEAVQLPDAVQLYDARKQSPKKSKPSPKHQVNT